jgi:hypothetical protein
MHVARSVHSFALSLTHILKRPVRHTAVRQKLASIENVDVDTSRARMGIRSCSEALIGNLLSSPQDIHISHRRSVTTLAALLTW